VLSSELLEPKWPSVVWVAENRGRPQLAPCRRKRPSRFVPELL